MSVFFSFSLMTTAGSTSLLSTEPGAEAGAAAGRDFRLDADGDLSLEEGDFTLIAGAEAVASALKARLQTFLGEYFLDSSIGVPYFTEVFGKPPAPRVEAVFREAILGTPGVAALQSLKLTREGRTLRLAFQVNTDFGEIIDAVLEV